MAGGFIVVLIDIKLKVMFANLLQKVREKMAAEQIQTLLPFAGKTNKRISL